jgi:4'-phosphopantetheinyl transferase
MMKINWEKLNIHFPPVSRIPQGFLDNKEIHVWKASLDGWATHLDKFYDYLSPIEKERADRFRFIEHRQRFICAHAVQRLILGAYLSQAPGKNEIQIDASGKPKIEAEPGSRKRPLYFNLSHSDGFLLLSVANDLETGVDLERVRSEYDEKVVSSHFFAKSEQSWIESMPEEQRKLAFFQLWTCKEAVLKAEGEGIRVNLGEVQIEFEESMEKAYCKLTDKNNQKRSWAIHLFSPESEYTAALAFEFDASAAPDPELKFFEWTDRTN